MPQKPHLEYPSTRYRDSYLAATREFQAEGRWTDLEYSELECDFKAFVCTQLNRAHTPLRPEYVPDSIFWLVNGGEFVGHVSLRRKLTAFLKTFGGHIGYEIRPSQRRRGYGKLICKLVLEEARAIGLKRVLITCDDTNIASSKIIETNGGILQDVTLLDWRTVPTRRYWIEIK